VADELTTQTVERVAFNNAQLVVQVAAIALEGVLDDAFGTLVALDAVTREDLNVDHGAGHARRNAQRGILDVGGLCPKTSCPVSTTLASCSSVLK